MARVAAWQEVAVSRDTVLNLVLLNVISLFLGLAKRLLLYIYFFLNRLLKQIQVKHIQLTKIFHIYRYLADPSGAGI